MLSNNPRTGRRGELDLSAVGLVYAGSAFGTVASPGLLSSIYGSKGLKRPG